MKPHSERYARHTFWQRVLWCQLVLFVAAPAAFALPPGPGTPPLPGQPDEQGPANAPAGGLQQARNSTEKMAMEQQRASVQAQESSAASDPCALLDDPQKRGLMSGPFETRLLLECGRENELGTVTSPPPALKGPTLALPGATNIPVNNPAADTNSTSHTQSETSIAVNENSGTICAAYNDSGSLHTGGSGLSGFSRSTDGGKTFVDKGLVPSGAGGTSWGDPSLVWRKADGKFYYASLCGPSTSGSLCLWKSNDDCATFNQISTIHSGTDDDKEMMAVDNTSGPHQGRLYVVWTDFSNGVIYATHSDNVSSWSTPVPLTAAGESVQGAWPAVGPSGELYVGWVKWDAWPAGPINIQLARSPDGGDSFARMTNPLTGGINPMKSSPTTYCGRPALNGNIRYSPFPQLTVGGDGSLHAVYSATPLPYGGTALVSENFNGTWPPTGWSTTNYGGTCVWHRNDFWPRANYTGGDGYSAAADSDKCGSGTTMNVDLNTPVFSLAGATNAMLEFKYDYNEFTSINDGFEVWLNDNGSWSNLLIWGDGDRRGPATQRLDLTPYIGHSNLYIAFYYHSDDWAWWVQVDDVRVVKNLINWPSSPDTIDVYYRRSTDQGTTWKPEVKLNDDATTSDQFFPTVSSDSRGKTIVATWYDRRLDTHNLLFDYYGRVSKDSGATWQGSKRLSTASSPVYLDPHLNTCYHGDYDQQAQYKGKAYVLWSDDRNVQDGHQDPDVWFNTIKTDDFPWPMFLPAITR